MKKTNRVFAILLVLVMLLSLTACGGTSSATASEEPSTAAESSETVETAEEEPSASTAQEPSETPAAESETSAEAAAEPEESEVPEGPAPLVLPLADGDVTLTYWYSYPPFIPNYLPSLEEKPVFEELTRVTGVNLDIIGVSQAALTEQFNLMIASSSYPDIIYGFGGSYIGSLDQAIDDEIILDLSELVDEYAPNYYALIHSDAEIELAVHTDEGRLPSFCGVNDDNMSINGGLVLRQDWLDELGLETPETYDDLYNVLVAFRDELNVPSPYWCNPSGIVSEIMAGYGITNTFYVVDGEVHFGFYEEAFGDFLTMMNQWYAEGLIYQDFYSQSSDQQFPENSLVNNGEVGVWYNSLNETLSYDTTTSGDEDFYIMATYMPVLNAGETSHFSSVFSKVDTTGGHFISTSCEDPVLAVQWCDYWYSEEGGLLANYGVQGLSWDYDENGDPAFNDVVLNNPEGLTFDIAISIYAQFNGGGYYIDNTKTDANYSDQQLQIREIWSTRNDNAYVYPSYAALNTEESEEISKLMSDMETYYDEQILKFIIGAKPMSEFNDYLETLQQMGIEECIAAYQSAYERYLAR